MIPFHHQSTFTSKAAAIAFSALWVLGTAAVQAEAFKFEQDGLLEDFFGSVQEYHGDSFKVIDKLPPSFLTEGTFSQDYVVSNSNKDDDDDETLYIILMQDAPVSRKLASHPDGHDRRSRHVIDYTRHLETEHRILADDEGITILRSFTNVLNGFAARLTQEQVASLKVNNRVLLIEKNQMFTINTSESPTQIALSESGQAWSQGYTGEDVVVGIIDSGIWPEHPSFADVMTPKFGNTGDFIPYGPIPKSFSGTECAFGNTAYNSTDASFSCNNKIIKAECYAVGFSTNIGPFCGGNGARLEGGSFLSARDDQSHGSHVAGTAAGNFGVEATFNGDLARIVTGMAPRARIAVYKVCWNGLSCQLVDIISAIDDASGDGVDVINLSLGSRNPSTAVALATFNAAGAGVRVVASAGNSGPDGSTIGFPSAYPWVTSVASAFKDGDVVLVPLTIVTPPAFQGQIYTAIVRRNTPPYAPEAYTGAVVNVGVACTPLAENLDMKIALVNLEGCDAEIFTKVVADAGAKSIIIYNDVPGLLSGGNGNFTASPLPVLALSTADALSLVAALAMGEVRITAGDTEAADSALVEFSSRGPFDDFLYKPDISAPGVFILAASVPVDTGSRGSGSAFAFFSGTSMASPHVAGLFAILTQKYPNWSPAAVKSAAMTTADPNGFIDVGNAEFVASSLGIGSGLVDGTSALDPGLIYDLSFLDYAAFTCASEAFNILDASVCSFLANGGITFGSDDDLNYPSFSKDDIVLEHIFTRTVTNVADTELPVTFCPVIELPSGFEVSITPEYLTLGKGESASFDLRLTFVGNVASTGDWAFGSLSWVGEEEVHKSGLTLAQKCSGSPSSKSLPSKKSSMKKSMTMKSSMTMKKSSMKSSMMMKSSIKSGMVKSSMKSKSSKRNLRRERPDKLSSANTLGASRLRKGGTEPSKSEIGQGTMNAPKTYTVQSPITVRTRPPVHVFDETLFTRSGESGSTDLSIYAREETQVTINVYGLKRAFPFTRTLTPGSPEVTGIRFNATQDLLYTATSTFDLQPNNPANIDLLIVEVFDEGGGNLLASSSNPSSSQEFVSVDFLPDGFGRNVTIGLFTRIISISGQAQFVQFVNSINRGQPPDVAVTGSGTFSLSPGTNTIPLSWSGLAQGALYDALVVVTNSDGEIVGKVPLRVRTF